jgi:2-methylaconitate cis-trans-isomerase PrpF
LSTPVQKTRYGVGIEMQSLECTIVRGGTSKGIYIERDQLPPPGPERDRVVLEIFGSPDVRQIDGLGGADKLTSKVAVMGPSTRADCEIDYLFGQVGTKLPTIDWAGNCGNLSAGAALYAAHRGYVRSNGAAVVELAIHQVNTGRRLRARVPMEGDRPALRGEFAIGGVPGTGPRIELDFGDFGGGAMRKGILPTGNVVDRFDVPGLPGLEASVIDAANLCVFVRARDVGLDPLAGVEALQADAALVARLESIRATVASAIGFVTEDVAYQMQVRLNPLLFAVAEPQAYRALDGTVVDAGAHDLLSRSIARFAFSKAYPATGSIGTAVAVGLDGSIANQALRGEAGPGREYRVRIGHPGGCLEVRTLLEGRELVSAVVGRTARVLMDGRVYPRA